jgi:DNA-3-methyladenine glycosylase
MNSLEQNSPPAPERYAEAQALPRTFYHGKTLSIAKALLGKGLYVEQAGQPILAEITEVEAYLAEKDPASHAFRGLTKRNWPMFEAGGTCYVYLSYGLNFCMNVSTQEAGLAEAILFRAARPILGLDLIRSRRPRARNDYQLLSGPGRLCQGLGIDLKHNGWTFDRGDFKIVDLGQRVAPSAIGTSTRIGITKASDKPWRFFIKSSPWLSRKG